jgi:Secretion system C-terminal sorting domain
VLCDSVGNLSSPVNYFVGQFPISVDLGDVDGDLDLDIVTSNFTGANFTLYENDGTGIFINRDDLPSNLAGSCAVFHDRDNDGDMDMTGIDEREDLLILFTNGQVTNVNEVENVPEGFTLYQNYPNPFNPETSLQYAVGSRQYVTLKVYDVLGNEITTLVSEEKSTGGYKVEFNGTGLPSGMYFYTLRARAFSETKKMVLIK